MEISNPKEFQQFFNLEGQILNEGPIPDDETNEELVPNNILPTKFSSDLFHSTQEICEKPGCVETAADFLLRMDRNVDPCDNFYDFVCKKWSHDTVIPDDKTEVSNFGSAVEEIYKKARILVEGKHKENSNTFL